MTEDEIAEIVNMTRNDPHFETMFGMINAGKFEMKVFVQLSLLHNLIL